MQLNASRLKALQAQDDVVNAMKEAAAKELLRISTQKRYKKAYTRSYCSESPQTKRTFCSSTFRKDDADMVQCVLEPAAAEYAEKANVCAPEIIVDKVFLKPDPSSADAHGPSCSGGVVLASHDGKIVFENTLDARLEVLFCKKFPKIRKNNVVMYSCGRVIL